MRNRLLSAAFSVAWWSFYGACIVAEAMDCKGWRDV